MFANVIRFTAFAVAEIIALLAETCLMKHLGVASPVIFWTILFQAAVGNAVVASADPTYGDGYLFAVLVTAGALGASLGSEPTHAKEGIFFGMICFAAMWATYRIRRRRDARRWLAHMRNRYLFPSPHL